MSFDAARKGGKSGAEARRAGLGTPATELLKSTARGGGLGGSRDPAPVVGGRKPWGDMDKEQWLKGKGEKDPFAPTKGVTPKMPMAMRFNDLKRTGFDKL